MPLRLWSVCPCAGTCGCPLPGPLGRAGGTRTQALMPECAAFPRTLAPRPGCGDRGLGRPVTICVPAVSGMTSAVCSVARSAAAATALHALCFSAVKVCERTPRLLPALCAPRWSRESDVASRSDRHGPSERQGQQAWRGGLSGGRPGRTGPTGPGLPHRRLSDPVGQETEALLLESLFLLFILA